MYNYKILLLIILFFSVKTSYSQITATTEFGKKVILYSNGTWKYNIKNDNYSKSQNYIILNDKKLIAGETTIINSADYEMSMTTSVTIAKDNINTLIIFWQNKCEDDLKWNGIVKLYLENYDIITLIDRGVKGINFLNENDIGTNIQKYSAYYLSNKDIIKLKKSNLSKIIYHKEIMGGTHIIDVNQNYNTLKEQLLEINR